MKIRASSLFPIFDILIASINLYIILPRALISIINNEKYKIFTISLLFGVLAFYFLPNDRMDLYRHYEKFEILKSTGENYYYQDLGLYYFFELIIFIGADPRWIAFSSSFTFYFILLRIFDSINHPCPKSRAVILFALLFSFPILMTTGLRYTTSVAFLMYAVIFFDRNKITASFLFFLALIFHFSSIVLFAIYIIVLLFRFHISHNKKLLLFFVFSILGVFLNNIVFIISDFLTIINNVVFGKIVFSPDYLTGKWGVERDDALSAFGLLIYKIKEKLLFIVLMLNLFIKSDSSKLSNLIFILSCLCALFISFGTIYFRFGYVCLVFIIYSRSYLFLIGRKQPLLPIFVLFCVSFTLITDLYAIRDEIFSSYNDFFKVSYMLELLNES